jgi:hypothetical protein
MAGKKAVRQYDFMGFLNDQGKGVKEGKRWDSGESVSSVVPRDPVTAHSWRINHIWQATQ